MAADIAGPSAPAEVERALLLTDVVDSTRLSAQLGDAAMSSLWTAHDRLARDLLREWRGREIDRSDGFLLMFEAAADAVAFAVRYHQALASMPVPLRSRAAVHLGRVRLRENSGEDVAQGAKPLEVDGLAKSLAARLMSLAQGGQTLLTAQARAALGPTELRLQSHGHWRMKGLEDPIEVFEVGDEAAPFLPPPDSAKAYRVVEVGQLWLPVQELRHGLPAERDAFVGRRDSLRELASRFDDGARLVSLVGIGGCGKTRLATHFAWTWLGSFPSGCWFCDLSQARDVDGIVAAVARGLDVPLGKDDPIQQLGHAIAGHGECLLILDNFEQVARFAEETLGRWLDLAGKARFLVTTREVLGLPGEQTLALAPLPQADAEALFMRRAVAAKHDFAPGPDDRAAVTPLVRLLDGLPLAIELCAARVRIMPPRLLLQRMGERFRLLSSGGGRQDRQATLRATFDWSWDLLLPHEKTALAQLSVFEGGFTLDAAEAVLDLSSTDAAPWTPDVLQSLVDKSFVVDQQGRRFSLLVSVQEYAAERLQQADASHAEATRLRHCRHFAALDETAATAGACADLANLMAACRVASLQGDALLAAAALRGALAALLLRGPFRLAVDLAAQVRALPGLTPPVRAWVEWSLASAQRAVGQVHEAELLLLSALALAREAADRPCEARALIGLGAICSTDGRTQLARQHDLAALAAAQALGDRALECEALCALGTLCDLEGELEEARQHHDKALALARRIGHRRWEGGALGNLGVWHASQGQWAEARPYFEASLAAAVEVGDRRWEGNALCNLGLMLEVQGQLGAARTSLLASLRVAREIGFQNLECIALCNLGQVEGKAGHPDEALRHFTQALAMARHIGNRRAEGQFLGYVGLLQGQQGLFDDARQSLAAGEAVLEALQDRPSLGLLLAQRAEVEWLAGEVESARVAARTARSMAEALGTGPESEFGAQLQRVSGWLEDSPS